MPKNLLSGSRVKNDLFEIDKFPFTSISPVNNASPFTESVFFMKSVYIK